MTVHIRTLNAGEWRAWRDLRLRALADSPDAFRPMLDEEQAHSDEFWEDIVGSTADHPRGNLWIAELDGRGVAMAFSSIDEEYTTVYAGAMWVAPEVRRTGIGGALLGAVVEWGSESATERAELWVTEANTAAVRFYESHGFTATDDIEALREGSDLVVRKLARPLLRGR